MSNRPPQQMRLVSRLVLSHAILAGVLVGVLVLMLVSLARMNALIGEVREQELGAIDAEEELHRVGWGIEVVARHAIDRCEAGASDSEVGPALAHGLAMLREAEARIGARAPRALRQAVAGYERFAERTISGSTCASLLSVQTRRERLRLDEDLTNAWIQRLFELHGAIRESEGEARKVGRRAFAIGTVLGVVALLVAVMLARRLALGVTSSLASLAQAARRVGDGDFSPIPAIRGPVEVVELATELDEMRARLAELDALKQGFLASVSHELRTPLAKLREALSLLGDGAAGPLSERQTRVVTIARNACEKEIGLVTALLDLSRLQAGHPLKPQQGASLDAVLEQALAGERPEAESRGVVVELTNIGGDAPRATLDPPLLERAVANLVRNAVSFSREGQTVHVERRLERRGEQPWAVITVRDDGPGVAPEVRDTLFTPFVTHTVATRPDRVGVGLGLALTREVARAHGGDVELVETDGPGAAFALSLPLEDRAVHAVVPTTPREIHS